MNTAAAAEPTATATVAATAARSATVTPHDGKSNKQVISTFKCTVRECNWVCCAQSSLTRHYQENHIEVYKEMIHSKKVRPSRKTLLALNLSTLDTEHSREGIFNSFVF